MKKQIDPMTLLTGLDKFFYEIGSVITAVITAGAILSALYGICWSVYTVIDNSIVTRKNVESILNQNFNDVYRECDLSSVKGKDGYMYTYICNNADVE